MIRNWVHVLAWLAIFGATTLLGRWLFEQDLIDPDGAFRYRHARPWIADRKMVRDADGLLQLFEALAFGDGAQTLRRFDKPLRVFIGGPRAAGHETTIMRALERVATLTELDVARVQSAAEANLEMLLVDHGQLRRAIASSRGEADPGRDPPLFASGLARVSPLPGGRIFGAVIAIEVEGSYVGRHVEAVLHHELLHALGFPGHPHPSFPSALAQKRPRFAVRFTETDEIMIRTLYDPRLPLGRDARTTRDAAWPVISELVAVKLARTD